MSEEAPTPYRPRPGSIPTLPVPEASSWTRLHLIGVGGAGMSGIARLLLARGVQVTGSDLKDSPGLHALRASGATLFVGHRPEQVGEPDAVVVSSAIPARNVELHETERRGLPVLMRAQVLAALMRGRHRVAVAGTHGKTTTTSMVSVMLARMGQQPTFVVGGDLNESGSGAEHGKGDVFVAEADESDGSFLLLDPHVAVITNVEEDHLDYYADRAEVEAAFGAFARTARSLVACWDDPGTRRAASGAGGPIIRYGFGEEADLRIADASVGRHGARGTIHLGPESATLRLSVPGRHNLLNAAAALGVAHRLDLPVAEAAAALGAFSGVRRRFDVRGTAGGATFVDDYAHHPTEVAATLAVARSNGRSRVVAVFQPHRYTRTQAMWRSLGESLAQADLVVVTEVYGAGERPIPGVSGKLVVEGLAEAEPGKRIVFLPRRSEIAPFLAREVREGDLVVTLGAGDVTTVGEETLSRLREAAR